MSDSAVKFVLNNYTLDESQEKIIHEIITTSKSENLKFRIVLCVLLNIR